MQRLLSPASWLQACSELHHPRALAIRGARSSFDLLIATADDLSAELLLFKDKPAYPHAGFPSILTQESRKWRNYYFRTSTSNMIRAVLFDAFGTLFRPRAPIHQQYSEVAASYGLIVSADDVKSGFRKAFKEISAQHPLYGKHSQPPLHYGDWWGLVIERTFQYANVADSDLQLALPTLLPDLIHRFWSDKGYVLHNDVLPCLEQLKTKGLALGIVSNSDPRVADVVQSLGIVPGYVSPEQVTTSWEIGFSKPSREIFEAAAIKLGYLPSQTIVVGDDIDEDYRGAKNAGLQAVLLKRASNKADYVRRRSREEELDEVNLLDTLKNLDSIISDNGVC